jgi:hydrogenase nickel incorporation protein HypB
MHGGARANWLESARSLHSQIQISLAQPTADVVIMTKADLAHAVEFDEAALRNIQAVRQGTEVFKLSAKTGEGMKDYLQFFENRRTKSRAAAAV